MTHASPAERAIVWTLAALFCVVCWLSVMAAVWTVARWIVGE